MTRDEGDSSDMRAALRAAMLDWREPLMAIASQPKRLCDNPWYMVDWESSQDTFEKLFWLDCEDATNNPDFRRRMEAAELFALLARVDYMLWKELVCELWPKDAQWADFFATRTTLRVGLAVKFAEDVNGVRQLNEYITTQRDRTTSASYKSFRCLMARVVGDRSLPCVLVRIYFVAHMEHYPALMVALVDALAGSAPDKDKLRALRITQLKINTTTHRANQTALDGIELLRAVGIQVTDLPVVDVSPWASSIVDCTKSLVSILDADASVDPSHAVSAGGIEKIAVDQTIQAELVPRLLASIHASRSLRFVQFDIEVSDDGEDESGDESVEDAAQDALRQRIVWWMALALFRRKTPLATVNIRASSLFMKDVEWMEQMLTTPNPMKLLYPEELDTDGPRVALSCQAVLDDPHSKQNTARQQSWTVHTAMSLDVLGKSRDGFVAVLLPGWGKAWVREEEATIVPKTDANELTITSPAHLIVNEMRAATMEAVLRLLSVVGRGIKHLAFDDCDFTDAFCTQVLSACPNLEELELCRVALRNYQCLHDAFQANRCRSLQKLTLWEIRLHESDAVDQLFTWLGTPREKMAVQLRKLRLLPIHFVDATTLESTLGVLSTSTRLRDVVLAFHVTKALRCAYETRFERLRRSTASEPLSSRCVCALLSAAAISEGHHRTAMKQFDSRIWSLVLAFAATPRIRSVTFSMMTY